MFSNQFPVAGRTVVVTGGSQGMGLAVARQLAEKGANVVIVARTEAKLKAGVEHITEGASSPETQRFHYVSADLTVPAEAVRVIDDVESWNEGPPDIVWCCAGTALPTLFIDTPVENLGKQMNSNYFVNAYMAHAILNKWLRPAGGSSSADKPAALDRHLIFTASVVAFFPMTGYTPYGPCKAALRNLSDTLSQEMNLYTASYPNEPRVRLHTIFPAGILSEGYEQENKVKPDVTKALEEMDENQPPEAIARKSIAGLESGLEIITTDTLSNLARISMLSHSGRGGFLRAFVDGLLASLVAFVVLIVRGDMDKTVQKWGRQHGASGMKDSESKA